MLCRNLCGSIETRRKHNDWVELIATKRGHVSNGEAIRSKVATPRLYKLKC